MPDTPTSAYTYVTVNIRWSPDPVTLSSYIGYPDLGKVFFLVRSPQTLQIRLFKPEAAKRARHLIPCLKTWEGRTALSELRDDIGGKKLNRFDTLSTAAVEDAGDGRRWRRMRLTLYLKIRAREYKDLRNDKTAYTFINVHPAAALDQDEFDTDDESNDSQPENRTLETVEDLPPHPAIERNIPRRLEPEGAAGSRSAPALSPGIGAGVGAGIGATGVAALPTETPTSDDDDDYESVPNTHTDEAPAPASPTQPLQASDAADDAATANDHVEDPGVQADQVPSESEHNTPAPSDIDRDDEDGDADGGHEREAGAHGNAEDELEAQARDFLARAVDEIPDPDAAGLADQMDIIMEGGGGREDEVTDDGTENVSLERKRKRGSVGDESSQREEEEEEEEGQERSPSKKSKSSEEPSTAAAAAATATAGQFLGFRQLLNSASRLFGQQTDTPPTIDTQQEQQHQPDTPKLIDTEHSKPKPDEDEPAPANPPSPARSRSRSASPSTSNNPFHLHLHATHERTLITAAQTEIALMKRFDYLQPKYVDLLNDLTALTAQLVHKIDKGSKEKSIEKARKKVEKCLKKVRKWQKKELHGLCVKEAFGLGNPGERDRAEEDKMDVDGEVVEKEEKEVAPDSATRAKRDTSEPGEGEVDNAEQTTEAEEAVPLTPEHKPSTEPQLPAAIAAPAEAEESTTPTQQPPHDVSTAPSLPHRLESEGYISSSPVPPAEQGQVLYPQIPMSDADIDSEPPIEPSAEQEYAGDAAEVISGEQLPRSSSPAIKLVSSPQKRHIGTPPARQAPVLSPAVETAGRDQGGRDIEAEELSASESESEHGDDAEVEARPSKTGSVQAGYFSRGLASLSQRIKPLLGSPTKKAQKEVAVPDAEEEEADDVATQSGDESQRSTPVPVTASQQPTQDIITKAQSNASDPHPESESSSESESEEEEEKSLAAPSQPNSPSTANPSSQSKKPLNLDNLADSSSSDSDSEDGSKKKKRSSPRPSLGHLVKNNKPSQSLQRRSIAHSQPAQSSIKTKSTALNDSSDNDSDSDSDKDDDDDDDDGTDLLSQSQSRVQSPVRTRPTTTMNSPAIVGRRGMPFSASQPATTAAAGSGGRRQQRNTLKSLLSSQRSAGGL
ncbi:hypothetical protein KEM56_000627 [Ascosphaera pollenicola]|nr:hypothetical protein KEM56_000627 [Ascosphaera pollenicola]